MIEDVTVSVDENEPLWAPVVLLSFREKSVQTGSCVAFKVFNGTQVNWAFVHKQ